MIPPNFEEWCRDKEARQLGETHYGMNAPIEKQVLVLMDEQSKIEQLLQRIDYLEKLVTTCRPCVLGLRDVLCAKYGKQSKDVAVLDMLLAEMRKVGHAD